MKRWIHAAYDPETADLYIVKIWHEIDPGHDVAAPEAAEEIFDIVAGSPSEAIERAKDQWSGPIDRIEIVDVNPEDYVPFDSFDVWYDSLASSEQARVDDLADDLGLPLYDDCSEAELAMLRDCFISR